MRHTSRKSAVKPTRPRAWRAWLCCAAIATATPAHAAKIPVMFGTHETLEEIQPIDEKGPNGEALYLGYKYSRYSFILPYRLVDDGYVVGIRGKNSFYRLDPDKLQALQSAGRLPTPLPPYEISPFVYAFGHSIWAVPFLIGGLIWWGRRSQKTLALAQPHFDSGLAHHKNDDLNAAVADYTKAIEINPKFAAALLNRATALSAQGLADKAISDYSKLIALEPEFVAGLLARGQLFEERGQLDTAIADYTRAIKASKAGVAYFCRAAAYAAKGDHTRAIKDYTAAIEKEPTSAIAYRERARAYQAQGRQQDAQVDMAKSDELAAGLATA
jgi:tetratricopeptide (TPR) repeat protein